LSIRLAITEKCGREVVAQTGEVIEVIMVGTWFSHNG
jgi:hypothetical protein